MLAGFFLTCDQPFHAGFLCLQLPHFLYYLVSLSFHRLFYFILFVIISCHSFSYHLFPSVSFSFPSLSFYFPSPLFLFLFIFFFLNSLSISFLHFPSISYSFHLFSSRSFSFFLCPYFSFPSVYMFCFAYYFLTSL